MYLTTYMGKGAVLLKNNSKNKRPRKTLCLPVATADVENFQYKTLKKTIVFSKKIVCKCIYIVYFLKLVARFGQNI